ncbi:MAG: ABC transporter permease [Ignavibacteriaceae bacterium]
MNLFEIIIQSFQSIKENKLRTSLTILGIVVGIFSIIVIMTIITMLQTTINSGFSFLSKDSFEIMKYPPLNKNNSKEFRNRKDITLTDFYELEGLLTQAKYMGAALSRGGAVIKYGSIETNPNIAVAGITEGFLNTANIKIDRGREIRSNDIRYTANICLIGPDVVDKLFPAIDPIGQYAKVDGRPLLIIGVLQKRPAIFGQTMDNYIIIPITTYYSMYGGRRSNVSITVTTYNDDDYDATIDAAIGYMRTIRKVQPGKENDFAIMSNESLIGQINDITSGVKVGAIVVSVIALLAAGVGIMNIMLVSVTERTREIGIRKAVGANKWNILYQFLVEAITLCCAGGIIGIILGIGIGNLVGGLLNATSVIPYDWVLVGLTICVFVGLVFGTYPAYKAANLDPIEALRYE